MARPQPGIFAQGTRSHYHLEFDLRPDATDAAICAALGGLREPPVTAGGSNIVVGFGPALWRRLPSPPFRSRRRPPFSPAASACSPCSGGAAENSAGSRRMDGLASPGALTSAAVLVLAGAGFAVTLLGSWHSSSTVAVAPRSMPTPNLPRPPRINPSDVRTVSPGQTSHAPGAMAAAMLGAKRVRYQRVDLVPGLSSLAASGRVRRRHRPSLRIDGAR